MLLRGYTFGTSLLECNTFAETINAIASLAEGIGGRFGSGLSMRVKAPSFKTLFSIILLLTSAWMTVSIFV